MFICLGYREFGKGKTVAEAFEAYQEQGGEESLDDMTFYPIGDAVEVEIQVKQVEVPTISVTSKRK